MPKLSLTWKIFLGTAGVVTAVLAGTLYATNRSATRASDQAISRGLEATSEQISAILGGRQRGMLNGADVFVQNPSFREQLGRNNPGDVLDQADEAAQRIGATWVQITNAGGIRLAKTSERSAGPEDLSESSMIGGALEGAGTTGFGVDGDSALFQAVAVPIQGAAIGSVVGVLMATRKVDDSLAASVRAATESDVVFYFLDSTGAPRVATSTFGRDSALLSFLGRYAPRPDSAGAPPAGPATDSAASPGLAEVELGGKHYVARGAPLRSASGRVLGGYVALRSRDAELGAFQALRDTILFGGAIGVALAFLLSYLIARQITRPVTALVGATRRAAEGDYAADIEVQSSDEIGTLANAFRAMLFDLRDKQALVDFLSRAEDSKTVPIAAMSRTQVYAMQEMGVTVEPGQTFAGRYDIKEVLGVGGMGMVYKANDRELGEVLALKTLKPDLMSQDPSALERFKNEIRLARKIAHRNVVRTYDLGENSGIYFITMEYVEGRSLKDLIRSRGKLPVPAVLTIAKQLCRALESAHEQGVIHRDIKPQNMVVEPDGVLKVMDFGIARLAVRSPGAGMTQAGMVVGTPEYMAPEQLLGDDVDPRVDIWATGVVIYECLTGTLPFTADSPIVLISKLLEETPPTPRSASSDIPQALSDLVMRTMAKQREDRPASAAELHDLLAAIG